MRKPSELLRQRKIVPLELFNWRAMPAPLLILLLGAVIGVVLFGPALVRLLALVLTGSLLLSELALAAALLLPSVRMLFRTELPLPPVARLLPAPQQLYPHGELRRGRIRARESFFLDGDRCVAALVRARDRRGVYVWRLQTTELEVVTETSVLRACGLLLLDGQALPLDRPSQLRLPEGLPGTLEKLALHDGDEVELRGPLSREQAAAGYRQTAEIEVMRGVPGNPVEIRRLC